MTETGRHKTNTGETVLYSGRDDNQHHEGVAVILKKQMEKCLMEWRPVNKQTHESQIVNTLISHLSNVMHQQMTVIK